MKYYSQKDIINALKKIGIKKKDNIFVNPEIYRFGLFNDASNNHDYFNIFYKILNNLIGPNGTLCMNTYSFNTLRYNESFNYHNIKTTSGKLSEILLKDKNSIRSHHPVFSVTAIGKQASFICKNNSLNNYGYNSPYNKFLKTNGKIINLGMEPWQNPFNHVSEFLIGVPYYYNKFTNVKYLRNKKIINIKFSSFVRYLNFDLVENFNEIKKELINQNLVKSSKLGDGYVFSINAKKYVDACIKVLSKNQFAFIDEKSYIKSLK